MSVLFISDLHLDPARPGSIERFVGFMRSEALYAEHLYVLGDLFEAWIGDDEDDPGVQPVLDAFAHLSSADVPCSVMHGNRDFLLGPGFETRTGCRIVNDPVCIDLYGRPVLLMHGDLLCTDDHAYMNLRKTVRDPQWQAEFLGQTLEERRQIARDLRDQSRSETASKAEDIMDVNQLAVEDTMRRHGVQILVHGHTHRPGVHHFELDGQRATRIVLGDWYDDGSIVHWDRSGFRLTTAPAAD